MTTENRLIVSGIVYKIPIYTVSPSGIPHCQFMLEHRSVQQEVNFSRLAWCRLPVIMSGSNTCDITRSINIGTQITVFGFISCHRRRNGLSKIVLHAQQLNLIDSGD